MSPFRRAQRHRRFPCSASPLEARHPLACAKPSCLACKSRVCHPCQTRSAESGGKPHNVPMVHCGQAPFGWPTPNGSPGLAAPFRACRCTRTCRRTVHITDDRVRPVGDLAGSNRAGLVRAGPAMELEVGHSPPTLLRNDLTQARPDAVTQFRKLHTDLPAIHPHKLLDPHNPPERREASGRGPYVHVKPQAAANRKKPLGNESDSGLAEVHAEHAPDLWGRRLRNGLSRSRIIEPDANARTPVPTETRSHVVTLRAEGAI